MNLIKHPRHLHFKKHGERYLAEGKPIFVVLGLAIPSFFAQLVNVLYSVVDRIYIGHMEAVGSIALAGVGVCGPIVTLIASFGTLIGLGGSPTMSIRLGEGNKEEAKRILNNGALMLVVLSVILTGVVFAFRMPILHLFGAGGESEIYADEYFTWYSVGTLFAVLSTGLNNFIVGQGYGKTGMATVLVGAVANIALDPLFIFTFGMGVRGAAIATVISQFLSALFTVLVLLNKRTLVTIGFGGYSLRVMRNIFTLGLSPFLIIATDSALVLALNGVLRIHGGDQADAMIAATTIMLSFMQIVTLPMGGISGGTQPAISYNYGANQPARVKRCQLYILLLCLGYAVIMFFLARFAAHPILSVFTDDAALLATSERYLKIYTMMLIPLAFQYAFVDGVTALGIAPAAISISLFRKIVLMLPLTLILPAVFGAESVFYAEPIADGIGGMVSTIVYLLLINRLLRKRAEAVRKAQAATKIPG